MDNSNNLTDINGPIFIKASGYYVMHPLLFMHLWNRSSSVGEVVNQLRQSWNQYARENVLIPDKNGVVREPKMSSGAILNRVKTFRKNGTFMKKLPKANISRYNWSEIIAQSKQYADPTNVSRGNSLSKGFFNR